MSHWYAESALARANAAMLAEVAEGLSRPQKELPPKYFYDHRGSELFEEITRLPEYYLTRAERAILAEWMPALLPRLGSGTLVELGAGSGEKTRIILGAMRPAAGGRVYVPIDVSAEFLAETADRMRRDFPGLGVVPVVADIGARFDLPGGLPRPLLAAFLGSTIGNFDRAGATRLLRAVRRLLRPGDRFLLGVDLRKEVAVIEAAYNDSRGVTAEFNRNMLRVVNRELGADFDPAAFEHRAFYEPTEHRIEMHLVSTADQVVHIPGLAPVRFAAGETLRTEISCKHDRASAAALLERAGLVLEEWRTDAEGRFALLVAAPAPEPARATRRWSAFADHVQDALFARPAGAGARRIGAEIEFIAVERESRAAAPLEGAAGSVLAALRTHALRVGGAEERSAKNVPVFRLPDGGTLGVEPGGQIEYSAPPCRSGSALVRSLRTTASGLRDAAAREGLELLSLGIDPVNPVERCPLQLESKRYVRMAEYFAAIGPWGARMMRQTAALQVTLDFEGDTYLRWRALNALAPYLTAVFANSPVYEGRETGHRSLRAHCWRSLDPRRTGTPWSARRPAACYAEFALDAPAMLLPRDGGEPLPFREWIARGGATLEDWREHLTTLFPEVRPRGYFEVRGMDAIPAEWYAAPVALLGGLVYDRAALHEANDLLGDPDPDLLARAGREGLRDPSIRETACRLVELALAGCRHLGPAFLSPDDLERAADFFGRYTRRGRSPADG